MIHENIYFTVFEGRLIKQKVLIFKFNACTVFVTDLQNFNIN